MDLVSEQEHQVWLREVIEDAAAQAANHQEFRMSFVVGYLLGAAGYPKHVTIRSIIERAARRRAHKAEVTHDAK